MRIICTFAIIMLLGLSSCHKSNASMHSFDYGDFDNLRIEWNNFFDPEESDYYVYFYSEQCYHCGLIKQNILEYISTSDKCFYLLPYQLGIPINKDIEMTIGANNLEQMWFGGTPSLVYLENKAVKNNVLGVQNICSYLQLN